MLNNKKGLSYVEIIISMAIMSIVAVAALSYIVYAKSMIVKAENYSSATEFLVQELEALASCDYGDPSLDPAGNPHEALLPEDSNLRYKYGGTRSYEVTTGRWASNDSNSEYKKIIATVQWDDGTQRSLSLEALVRKQ